MNILRTKPINADVQKDSGLKRCLSALDLTILGIGAIIGAGIFVLTGVAAATHAGPAIMVSFVIAGFACAFAALSYAELAAMIGGCGSAYGYSYAGFGEILAWIIGWDLILEYSVATSAVAIGWSSYVNNALKAMGIQLPIELVHSPVEGGLINLPAAGIILFLAILLALGVHHSARFNTVMVVIKLLAISIFIGVGASHIDVANWQPFAPFGWPGIASGAAIIFFAYIGFDAVSTAAEEAKNPRRDLPIGILGSLIVCTLIYMAVAAILTGIVPYQSLNSPSPVADALLRLGHRWAAGFVAAGAIAGLTTVMLVLYYGLTRIILSISRDGLLPLAFSRVNSHTQTPVRLILASGLCMSMIAGFTPIGDVAELVNIGTLAAFVTVCAGVLMLRYTRPDLHRPFKTPLMPFIPLLGILFCLYLMASLPFITWIRFAIWLAFGIIVYFAYSYRHSELQPKR
ncbi:MAG: amino acid permease [Gammaproteobacteria bacterium]|nr:amino acid permease [Gammaproteobacteria bacterium]